MAISVKALKSAFGSYVARAHAAPELRIADLRSALVDCERGKADPGYVLDVANEVLGGHGVERIGVGASWVGYYVNMGDTYAATLLWNVRKERFVITTWGDFVEQHERRATAS